jgi:hydrogenase/urease accessory protein HupE
MSSPKTKTTLLALLLSAAVAQAHEIGTTRVNVLFREGRTYDVEIVTDAASLAEKLAVTAGRPSPAGSPAAIEQFRQRVHLAFDGVAVSPAIAYSVNRASTPTATIRLTGPIPAGARTFTWNYGWTFASYALLLRDSSSPDPATQWLEGDQTSKPFALAAAPPAATRLATVVRYLTLGFTHILPNGFDHMLFVLGIYLLSGRARTVLSQVSAFTEAHSITLGLSMYGLVSVSPRVVEPMIAVSIAYVAIENLFLSELKSWRIALVFAFGLLHGMGFAGALKELALPRTEFLTALLTFNIGVEAGQLAVIATAFLLVGWHYSHRSWYRARVVVPASATIACTAIYWTVQRLAA